MINYVEWGGVWRMVCAGVAWDGVWLRGLWRVMFGVVGCGRVACDGCGGAGWVVGGATGCGGLGCG